MKPNLLFIPLLFFPITGYGDYRELGAVPRLSVQFADHGIGTYAYGGLAYGDASGGVFRGPSIKAGYGQHGHKLNASWFYSAGGMANIDLGISKYYIDSEYKGIDVFGGDSVAMELTLGMFILQVNLVISEDGSNFANLGIGF